MKMQFNIVVEADGLDFHAVIRQVGEEEVKKFSPKLYSLFAQVEAHVAKQLVKAGIANKPLEE